MVKRNGTVIRRDVERVGYSPVQPLGKQMPEDSPEIIQKCLQCERPKCTNCLGEREHRPKHKGKPSYYIVKDRKTGEVLAQGKVSAVARVMQVTDRAVWSWSRYGSSKYIVERIK